MVVEFTALVSYVITHSEQTLESELDHGSSSDTSIIIRNTAAKATKFTQSFKKF